MTTKLDQLIANASSVKPVAVEAQTKSERQPSEFWLNVGIMAGDLGFVQITGMPLDHLKPQKVSGSNTEWIQRISTSNNLLEAMQQAVKELKPGENKIISEPTDKFQLQLVRANLKGAEPQPLVSVEEIKAKLFG